MKRDWILILVLLAGCGAAGYAFYADATAGATWDSTKEIERTGAVPVVQDWEGMPEGERPIAYPYWDKKEPIEAYAKRAGLPPEIAFDLGAGVALEMVLIPAGKAELGTPEPDRPAAVWRGSLAFLCGVVAFALTILGSVLHARRNHTRVQFSLRWLLLMASAASMALIGALHWRELAQRHEVYVTQLQLWRKAAAQATEFKTPFYMAKYETTNAQYERIFAVQPQPPLLARQPGSASPQEPVARIGLDDASAIGDCISSFLKKPQRQPWGSLIRLPAKSEWEYACRAGRNTIYHAGDRTEDLDAVAWWSGNSGGHVHPVGQKAPNAFGIYDMHGNVDEWCYWDFGYGSSLEYYQACYRGGSFYGNEVTCAASFEVGMDGNFTNPGLGFRLMMTGPISEDQRAAFLEWLDELKKKDAAGPSAPDAASAAL